MSADTMTVGDAVARLEILASQKESDAGHFRGIGHAVTGALCEANARAIRTVLAALAMEPEMYCKTCGSCGILDCCGARCIYYEEHYEDFRRLRKESAALFRLQRYTKGKLLAASPTPETTP